MQMSAWCPNSTAGVHSLVVRITHVEGHGIMTYRKEIWTKQGHEVAVSNLTSNTHFWMTLSYSFRLSELISLSINCLLSLFPIIVKNQIIWQKVVKTLKSVLQKSKVKRTNTEGLSCWLGKQPKILDQHHNLMVICAKPGESLSHGTRIGCTSLGLLWTQWAEGRLETAATGRSRRQDLFIKAYCLGRKSKFLCAAWKTLATCP